MPEVGTAQDIPGGQEIGQTFSQALLMFFALLDQPGVNPDAGIIQEVIAVDLANIDLNFCSAVIKQAHGLFQVRRYANITGEMIEGPKRNYYQGYSCVDQA